MSSSSYANFIQTRRQLLSPNGPEPQWMPDFLYDFQRVLVDWSFRSARAALFADCGLGKTPMQLVWAQNVVQLTNKPVLIVTPLAVSSQTMREAEKFGVECRRSSDGRIGSSASVVVTNYERLDRFDPMLFGGAVCDESSILKNFDGATKAVINEFVRTLPYRLLCTATAAPNDYIEFGTSSEALGYLGYMDMLTEFFKNDEGSIKPLSYQTKWRFKPHAEPHFWRWMCSWARALRRPSDLGFENKAFNLTALHEHVSMVDIDYQLQDGRLFSTFGATLQDQRRERRDTLTKRCERVAELSRHGRPFVSWCHLNDEGDLLDRLLLDAVQVSGDDSDDEKVEKFDAFSSGKVRGLITKPKIGGFGLNWQHCSDVTMFPSHSYEQYYQCVRRCWRFGQKRDVNVHIVTTEGEAAVMGNLKRKSEAADKAFDRIVSAMVEVIEGRQRSDSFDEPIWPEWLSEVRA